MKKLLVSSLAGLMAISLHLSASAAVISVPDVTVEPGTAFVDVPVTISGGDIFTDMSAIVFSGRGGEVTGNPPAPPIIDISPSDPFTPAFAYEGTVWEDTENAPGGFTPSAGSLSPPSPVLDEQVTLNTSGQNVVADGTLLTFRVDTSNMVEGDSFELSLGIADFQLTTLTNAGDAVATTFVDGSVSARAGAVIPEPGSFALVACALSPVVFSCVRRRRKQS